MFVLVFECETEAAIAPFAMGSVGGGVDVLAALDGPAGALRSSFFASGGLSGASSSCSSGSSLTRFTALLLLLLLSAGS